jgi:uncharacterized cupin superfamily protein
MSKTQDNAILSYMRTYATEDATFEAFELPAEDIIAGNPKTEVAVHHRSEDGSVLVGVSRFTEGTLRYHQTADEINYVTKGRLIITSDRDDQKIVCTAGSVTRLDKGVVYTKTIVEPYEEIFVMLSDSGVAM